MRSQFTFYASFAKALRRIKRDSDRAKAYDAICNYALYGEEPNVDAMPDVAAVAFDLIRPTLDASARKAKSGQAGGSKPQANDKQNESKPQANDKQTASEKEKKKEIENECLKENAKRKLFAAPTVEEVRAYCQSSGHHIDADAFVDYFVSCGWKVGNKPMKDWQAAVRNWERRDKKPSKAVQPDFNDSRRDDWLKQLVRSRGD